MAEPPKNGVRKVVFLTEVDFNIHMALPSKTFKKEMAFSDFSMKTYFLLFFVINMSFCYAG